MTGSEPAQDAPAPSWRAAPRYRRTNPWDRAVLDALESQLCGLQLLDTPVWVFDAERCQILWANRPGLDVWRADTVAELQERDVAATQSEAVYTLLNDYLRRCEAGESIAVWVTLSPLGTSRRFYQSHHLFVLADGRRVLLIEARPEPPAEELMAFASNYSLTIGLYEMDGRFVSGNPAFNRIGRSHPLHDLCTVLPAELASQDWAARLAEQSALVFEKELWTDRGLRSFRCELRRVLTHARRFRTLLSLFDLTERRLQEAERAKADAEAATAAKSLFLANMSHEIRTPLNAIIGFTHLCLRSGLDARQRQHLEKSQIAAQGLLSIVNDLLDFSKIEAGALELEREPFELAATLAALDSVLGQAARQQGLDLQFDVAADAPPHLVGDAMRLGQVLTNLVGNAIKFTPAGSVRLRVEPRSVDDGEVTLGFAVIDTGIGLTGPQIERVLQPFRQADPSTTRRYGGTGLGLAISRRIIEHMGGSLVIESEPGIGSTFRFDVRLGVGLEGAALPRPGADLEPATEARLHGAKLLVVEDNELNQRVVAELLHAAGALVTLAGDGLTALQILARQPFDLVLLDLQMPNLDGYDTARRVRSHPTLATLPLVALTADARPEDQARCMSVGMNDFVSKPVDPAALLGTVARWLPARAGEAGCAPRPAPARAPSLDAAPALDNPTLPAPPVDLSVLRALVNQDATKVARFAEAFLRNTQATVAEMTECGADRDLPGLGRLAHRLRSSAATVGARSLADRCRALETAALRHDPDTAWEVAATLPALVASIEAQLAAEQP